MKVYIKQPVALHEAGNADLNEDFVYPLISQVNAEEKLFIVCDGQGGANAGEVASKLVALNMAKYFASNPIKGEIDQEYLDHALKFVEEKLSTYKANHPESLDMATSMALLYLGSQHVTMAWVGNCEVVYFHSGSQKLSNTHDPEHSYHQEKISGVDNPAKIQMRFLPLEDIGAGDYFYLSTAGIKEHVDESTLSTLFESGNNPKNDPPKLLEEIRILNQGFAKDNYSCYLIQIDKLNTDPAATFIPEAKGAAAHADTDPVLKADDRQGFFRTLTFVGVIAIFACLVGLAIYWANSSGSETSEFENLMSRANTSIEQEDYNLAISRLDSARTIATTPEEEQAAILARQNAEARLAEAQKRYLDDQMGELTESAQVYLDLAESFFKEGQHIEAALNYRRAQKIMERDKLTEPALPFDRMAHAYLMAGNELYAENSGDCAFAEAYYEEGFYILQSAERKILDEEAHTLAIENRSHCYSDPGISTITSAETSAAEKNEEIPDASSTRAIPPAKDVSSSGTTGSATTSSPATSDPKPVEIASSARTTEPAPVTRSASPSGINNTRGLDPEVESSLNKYLSEGQRLYVRAKSENSNYLYKLSGENLLQAEAILDGPGAYMLAYMYHMGLGMTQDADKALQYAQKSALQNWPAGHFLYAHLLLVRQHPRDTLTARSSLERAANLNYPDAIFRLQELNGQ